jgi:hypothetical protein
MRFAQYAALLQSSLAWHGSYARPDVSRKKDARTPTTALIVLVMFLTSFPSLTLEQVHEQPTAWQDREYHTVKNWAIRK